MNTQVLNLTIPEHLYSNEELMSMIRSTLRNEKKFKQGKVVHKSKIIPPEKFLNSQMVKKVCL